MEYMRKNISTEIPIRAVHIDCRAQMLLFPRIIEVLHDLARWGFNTVLFEFENRFPYRGDLAGIVVEDALTRSQLRQLKKTAHDLGLQIIPLVQCLGHLEYLLHFQPFRRYAEPSSDKPPNSICPSHSKTHNVLRQMAAQVLDVFDEARYFHMGGDEVSLSADCRRCRDHLEAEGISGVLSQHYLEHAVWLRRQGPDPIIWGDMLSVHKCALDRLRGHVVIMDWDYSSGVKPASDPAIVQAVIGGDSLSPNDQSDHERDFLDRYLLMPDRQRLRPFPHVKYFQDQGFLAISASAIRSIGDNFCVPNKDHIDNIIGSARIARSQNLLGAAITSWALRRSPWPLTEYGLIAGGMTLQKPHVSRRQIDAAFAEDSFGIPEPDMAKLTGLLGGFVPGLVESLEEFDSEMGDFAPVEPWRFSNIQNMHSQYLRGVRMLRKNIPVAQELLTRAKPRSTRQRQRVEFWNWAIEVSSFFAQVRVTKGMSTSEIKNQLKQSAAEMNRLSTRTGKLMGKWYSKRTVAREMWCRFGSYLHNG